MNWRIVSATVILLVFCSSGVSQAQNIFPGLPRAAVYSVKFLCGFQNPIDVSPLGPQAEPPVKPGNYATAVNIHNFHTFPVSICKKAVLAPPERCFINKPANDPTCRSLIGPVIGPITMGPDDAFEVDCQDIVTLLRSLPPPPGGPTFIKGFVEIAVAPHVGLPVTNPISVTGVYTSITCPNPFNPATGTCSSQDPPHLFGFGAGLEVVPENSFIGEPTCKG